MAAVPGTSPGLTRKEEQCLEDRLRSASLEHVLDPQRWRIGLAQDLGPLFVDTRDPAHQSSTTVRSYDVPQFTNDDRGIDLKVQLYDRQSPAATPSRTSPSFETTGRQSHLWNLRVWIAT